MVIRSDSFDSVFVVSNEIGASNQTPEKRFRQVLEDSDDLLRFLSLFGSSTRRCFVRVWETRVRSVYRRKQGDCSLGRIRT